MWNGIGWYGFIGPTTSTTDISLGIFKLLLVIYFQNMCIVTCDLISSFSILELLIYHSHKTGFQLIGRLSLLSEFFE